MFVVWLLQHPQNKIVLKSYFVTHIKRAWVAVDELVPLLKALTCHTAKNERTRNPR